MYAKNLALAGGSMALAGGPVAWRAVPWRGDP